MSMSDRELADAGWLEITKTTDSYPTWKRKGYPASSHFAHAKTYFDQIGQAPVPPVVVLPPKTGPLTISKGGVYVVNAESTSLTAAVRITTVEPVVVRGQAENISGGPIFETPYPLACDVWIDQLHATGGQGRFFEGEGVKQVRITNATVEQTSGVHINTTVAAPGVIEILRNAWHNIRKCTDGIHEGHIMLQQVLAVAKPLIAWNQIINEYGIYDGEDCLSSYMSAHVAFLDNYVQGNYPVSLDAKSSGGGISIHRSQYTEARRNITTGCINGGIGIVAGADNVMDDNTVISSGRWHDGPLFAAANVGVTTYNDGSGPPTPPYARNVMTNNLVGHIKADGARNDVWLGDNATNADYAAWDAANTRLPNTPITAATEQAQWKVWQAKLAAAGVVVGAS